MNIFEYVNGSHETYPEYQYIAESLLLCFGGKYRIAYVRKKLQNSGMFWDDVSVSGKHPCVKKNTKAFSEDSNFLAEDIKHFLDNRGWEKGGSVAQKSEQLPF